MPTIKEVAKAAGVAPSTVSLILNKKAGPMRQETQDHVRRVATEMGYHPNAAARSLRAQRTNTIGFFSSHGMVTAHDPFFAEVVNGMREGCGEWRKRFLLFGDCFERPEDEVYAELMGGHLDGLVVQVYPHEPLAKRLAESLLPVVAIADIVPALPSVVADDREGSRLIAEYLAGRGHRCILYRRDGGIVNTDECFSDARRFKAFNKAAAELGMTVLVGAGVYDRPKHQTYLGPEEAKYLTAPPGDRPTAAVCSGDYGAYNLMSHCECLGLRVPDDLAIVGFDGAPTINHQGPRLTTICASWANVARTAMSHVLALQDGEEVPRETVLPVKLVIGDTA